MIIEILKFVSLFLTLSIFTIETLRAVYNKEIYTYLALFGIFTMTVFIYLQWLM